MTCYNLITEGNKLSYDRQKNKLYYAQEKARLTEANKKRGAIIVLNVRVVTSRLRATSYMSDAPQE